MKQLTATATTTALACVKGSIQQIAVATGKPLAKVLLGVSAVVMIDTSSSMSMRDSEDGQARHWVACRELAKLQATMPGKLAVVAFSSDVKFCPTGQPPEPEGGTDLRLALEFCKRFDVGQMKFILISDGDPDNRDTALAMARTYRNQIHTVYVGRSGTDAEGFLKQLAARSRGQSLEAHNVIGLLPAMQRLLTVG